MNLASQTGRQECELNVHLISDLNTVDQKICIHLFRFWDQTPGQLVHQDQRIPAQTHLPALLVLVTQINLGRTILGGEYAVVWASGLLIWTLCSGGVKVFQHVPVPVNIQRLCTATEEERTNNCGVILLIGRNQQLDQCTAELWEVHSTR